MQRASGERVDRASAIMALLRGEISHAALAHQFSVPITEVKRWELDFIEGGKIALNSQLHGVEGSQHGQIADLEGRIVVARDQLSQVNALNAISQSLSAILDLDKLLETTLDTLYWVFGYVPSVALVVGDDLIIEAGFALDDTKINWYDWQFRISTGKSIIAWVAANGRRLNVTEVQQDRGYAYHQTVD